MLRVVIISVALLYIASCQSDHERQASAISDMVNQVSDELNELGFEVDVDEISIEVRDADAVSDMFNDLSDESKQEVNSYTPSLAHVGEKPSKNDARLAFYDPNSKTLVVKSGVLGKLTKGYLAHELAHVYQDQRWGLENIWQPFAHSPSRETFNITQYVIEGHAELARYAYEQAQAANPVAIADLSVSLGRVFDNECSVCHSRDSTSNLPYSMGMRFLARQYRIGGWPRVQKNLLNLPSSSEQILHPDKYLLDEPTPVSLPTWPKGKLEFSGPMGEAFLLTELLSLGVPSVEAFTSASGWDGDMAQIYLLPDQKKVMVWRIAADRRLDALQLQNTLTDYDKKGQNNRVGRVVDWIISDQQDAIKDVQAFLGAHPASLASGAESDVEDEMTTSSQELSVTREVEAFFEPRKRTRIVIGPNNE